MHLHMNSHKPKQPRMSFVVVVRTSELTLAVHGPYRSFKRAEGDAKAWGGSVEPMQRAPYPSEGKSQS